MGLRRSQLAFLALAVALSAASFAVAANPVVPADAKVGQTLADGYEVKAVTKEWTVLEKADISSGEILIVTPDGKTTPIKKTIGSVGKHSDPPQVVQYPKEFWDKLAIAKNDFLAEQYLAEKNAKNEDPSFADIRKLFPPLLYPETAVGMNSYPCSVTVAGNGAVELNFFFINNVEPNWATYAPRFNFLLNGRAPTEKECEQTIRRGLIGGWMPATDFRYRMADQPLGWEQVVLMGHYRGVPGLFIRFHIVNTDAKPQPVSFAVEAPAGNPFVTSPEGMSLLASFNSMAANTFGKEEKRPDILNMRETAPFTLPISTSIPCELKNAQATWQFTLPPQAGRDLVLFYPSQHQGQFTRLPDAETETAFYAALLEQYRSWERDLAPAAQIPTPEPELENLFKATLCRILCAANGDKFSGGLIHYRGFWQFTHLHACRLMIEAGMFARARASLIYFMENRIKDDGKFRFDANINDSCYQIFDVGEFLQALASYTQASGDNSLILQYQKQIDRTIDMLKRNRAESARRFPKDDPRHAMLLGSFENDVPEKSYYYTSDVHVAFGLRDYTLMLEQMAATESGKPLTEKAKAMRAFYDDFSSSLRASLDRAGKLLDKNGKTITFNCQPDIDKKGFKSPLFTDLHLNAYRRFQQHPRMFAHSFFTDAETAAFLDFQAKSDQTVLGVRRWIPEVIDDFVAFEIDYQRLRLDRVREFQMKLFAYLQLQSAVGTWTGFEQTHYRPESGLRARGSHPPYRRFWPMGRGMITCEGLHATIVTPMLVKQAFCFNEPTADAVWLAAGIPTHWLKDNQPLAAKRLGSRYGLVNLTLTWKADDRKLVAEIAPQPGRTMTEVRLRLRAPGMKSVKSATLADGTACELRGDLAILKNLTKPTTVIAEVVK